MGDMERFSYRARFASLPCIGAVDLVGDWYVPFVFATFSPTHAAFLQM